MNGIKFALWVTVLFAIIYAFTGLFTSLNEFGVGMLIAALAAIGAGCVDYCQARHDERILEERLMVWCRRDQ